MPYCPNCGVKLKIENAKFCPECGFNLTIMSSDQKQEQSISSTTVVAVSGKTDQELAVSTSPSVIPTPFSGEKPEDEKPASFRFNPYDLGVKLEETVEKIYQADGYTTRKRERLVGVKARHEIDIIAERGKDKIAIECKNYTNTVGIEKIQKFSHTLGDLRNEYHGVIAVNSELSGPAEDLARAEGIEWLDRDELKDRYWAISVGRTSGKGDNITLEDALPLNYDFEQVSKLDLRNKEMVQIQDAKLTFHPYAIIQFRFNARWTDPIKKHYKFNDSGDIVVDMLDGEVLNPPVLNEIGSVINVVKSVLSKEARSENVRRKKIRDEAIQTPPSSQYTISISEDYKIIKLPAKITLADAKGFAIDYIVQRNTHTVNYSIERKDSFPEFHQATFVPTNRDITIVKNDAVLFPKWAVHFRALDEVYTREALGYSGTLFEDTIRNCPNHRTAGILGIKKKNIAVCEVCGNAYCENHIYQCPVCKKWLCEEHSVECSSCKARFCKEDALQICQNSQLPICSDCTVECPMCKKTVGKSHLQKCETCGVTGCESCVKTAGVLFKKRKTCRTCFEKAK